MSDLDDFTFHKSLAGLFVGLETAAPLRGTGSLKMHRNGQPAGYVSSVRNTGNKAFTTGRVRFLCQASGFASNTSIGFCFQMSQANLTGAAGTGYWFRWFIGASSTTHTLRIDRLTSGLVQSFVNICLSPAFTLAVNTPMALECSWILDLVALGGIQFNVQRGSALDYSDLAPVSGMTGVVSSTSVLQTSVGEGPAWQADVTTQHNFLWDDIHCVPLLVG